ncbi:hypothetical protein G5I_10593 [Acromyrmex echinatior]|uniref:Uncharacterized protein n=1 Tax=Acromyrmex echinatior TaxID=103372 RepID=F4WXA9_ACREC|nr:hypothetical protein G5I_10593 [Acromyrmex echinatior]
MSFRVPVKRTTAYSYDGQLQQQLEIIKSEIHAIKKDFDTCYLKLELMKFEEEKPVKQEGLMIDR